MGRVVGFGHDPSKNFRNSLALEKRFSALFTYGTGRKLLLHNAPPKVKFPQSAPAQKIEKKKKNEKAADS